MTEELYNKIDKFCNETDWSKYPTYEHALEEFIKEIVEEETKELKEENKVLAQNLEDTEILNKTYEKRFDDLEKENAELKEELKKWKDEWQEQVQKATDEGYARTLQTIQLSKAKEIIREFVEWATWQGNSKCPSFKSIQDKAEQFLKDSEVEK